MPSYYYHLKFELYPTVDPSAQAAEGASAEDIWVPGPASTIFDDLPSHTRKNVPLRSERQQQKSAEPPSEYSRPAANHAPTGGVIDCGASRAAANEDEGNIARLSERQWRERSRSFPPPGFAAGLGPRTAAKDWRFGRLSIESLDPPPPPPPPQADMADYTNPTPAASLGPNLGGPGQATKARYISLVTKNTEIGWGIVHLYSEGVDGQTLDQDTRDAASDDGDDAAAADGESGGDEPTILCIPSVPSYLSPSDFLGFVGEKWRGDVSHYRMVMTSRMNRYMVLMKFRDSKRAKEWRKEFDGKVFNSMEAEICHVTFIKSITVERPRKPRGHLPESSTGGGIISNSMKPFPPPTPNLTELPTCTVCLERMDDTAGLMTILCQHVFHCTCLQTWKGQGCPVCRATNPSLATSPSASDPYAYDPSNPYSRPFGNGVSNLCSVCDCADDLWICLICGNVGCGRYKGGHAKEHWKETAHSFSLELEKQHVWDYAGDMWVHRLIRSKGDGKVVELPSRSMRDGGHGEDVVPRAKLESIGMEYTHLLTSQLESQRVYFEEMVNKAADKASKASAAAETATAQAVEAHRLLGALRAEHQVLTSDTIPGLERSMEREKKRADKASELARSMGKSLQEEKKVSEGLMDRINHNKKKKKKQNNKTTKKTRSM